MFRYRRGPQHKTETSADGQNVIVGSVHFSAVAEFMLLRNAHRIWVYGRNDLGPARRGACANFLHHLIRGLGVEFASAWVFGGVSGTFTR